MSDDASDKERETLLERATIGDAEAVSRLLAEYLPRVRAFVRLQMNAGLRARESSTDLVQSVCVDLLRQQDGFEYRGEAQFRAWLFQAALNKVRERQRFWLREKRDVRREQAPPASESSSAPRLSQVYMTLGTPSREMMAEEHMAQLEGAFDQLPPQYREAITLSRVMGLSHEQVAEQMQRSVGAVRQLLGRGLVRLAELLEKRDAGNS